MLMFTILSNLILNSYIIIIYNFFLSLNCKICIYTIINDCIL